MLLLSRMFLGSFFHRVGPAQANARRPKRSRLTLGTSSSNPPAERSERGGVWRRSSVARYSGVPLYMALCTSTSSLKSIRFLTGNQCNCRSIVVMDCRSPRRICLTIRAADRWKADKNDEKRSTGHITVHKLKVVSVNARSIMNKLDELQCIAVEENPDIICITETWAHKDITDAELNLEGYNLVRNDREDMKEVDVSYT
ncbi:hypothetical protein NP493_1538g00003 [Ridgeia piscesae]|uniref:Endonuclease/exonuclease/phosphatase domain-containing protein n=1 Tax=Ridgeia piscesae TaxID=27915 RepID=A0AAD9N9S9_RIDPI|nr:hypothetical protein NP493_1538g00003 [Ridgeia piscesae]